MLRKKKYFSTIRRGEISEWKKDLSSTRENVRKEAVKKIVAAMTVGKDVGMLFTEVINCSQTNNVELKKLVYLYIQNYAAQNADLAILTVSSLVKDLEHPNALIRGLALRTMSSLGISEMLEYLTEPLKKCLKDDDPYVRKIAALAVAKYFKRAPSEAIERGLMEDLEKRLRDNNSMVVSNTVISLMEICQHTPMNENIEIKFTRKTIKTLLFSLNLCSEWGQIQIIDSLSQYRPVDFEQCDMIFEKVVPLLQHENPSLVLSCIKLVLNLWKYKGDGIPNSQLTKKVKQSLITLACMKEKPEMQYIVLRNIQLILNKYPKLLSANIKIFFCVFDDPSYVKIEKLHVLYQLVSEQNAEMVLLELRDYINEVDIEFVKASILTISKVVIKLPSCIGAVIPILVNILNTKIQYAVEQCIIVLRSILKKYPKNFTKVIQLCFEGLELIEDPRAKSSLIWIIGEYYSLLESGMDILDLFSQHFIDEDEFVQMELLNSHMKIFLKHPSERTKDALETVLTMSTEDCKNADLRDKSYIFYRLIQQGVAKEVILDEDEDDEEEKKEGNGEEEEDDDDDDEFKKERLEFQELMIKNLNSVCSILHKAPSMFIPAYRPLKVISGVEYKERKEKEEKEKKSDDDDDDNEEEEEEPRKEEPIKSGQLIPGMDSFFTSEKEKEPVSTTSTTTTTAPPSGSLLNFDNLFGGVEKKEEEEEKKEETPILLVEKDGLKIYGRILPSENHQKSVMDYHLFFENIGDSPFKGMALKIRKNVFSLFPSEKVMKVLIPEHGKTKYVLPIVLDDSNYQEIQENEEDEELNVLTCAVRDQHKNIRFLKQSFPISLLFNEKKEDIGNQEFVMIWKSYSKETESRIPLPFLNEQTFNEEKVKEQFESKRVFFVGRMAKKNGDLNWYFYASLYAEKSEVNIVCELRKRINGLFFLSSRASPKGILKYFEKEIVESIK